MKLYQSLLVASALMGASFQTADAKKVHTIGDSTMQTYDESVSVTRGWAQYLQPFFNGLEVNNRGKAGASSKSFYEEVAFWTSVKKQLQPGDYVVIQFAHNDEKNGGMDGDELKAYYTKAGNTELATSTDYRGTTPSDTYKKYLRKYVTETREAGCTPILCGPICRLYFNGNSIKRNGRHDLGDSFSKLTANGPVEGQKVAATDHSMDYVYQMKEVAKEMDVPFVDLTTGSAELFLSYGEADCKAILGNGTDGTHLGATGATLIARKFAQLCKEQGLFTEYINLTGELNVTPADADLGEAYKGQTLSREFMVTAYDITPAKGNVTVSGTGSMQFSTDNDKWSSTISLPYENGTLLSRFYVSLSLDQAGELTETMTIQAGDKQKVIPVKATSVVLTGGQEVNAYWRLEKNNECEVTGPVDIIPETYVGMVLQKYANPNASTVWPEWTGFDASRKTQRNLIEGENWPAGEIDEVSTRYIEFGVKASKATTLKIDEISCFLCGCGGNGMCVKVYYSTEDNFADPKMIFTRSAMPANNMLYIKDTPVLSLDEGQALRLRFYPWYNSKASGKTICLSDIKIHGYAVGSDESGLAGVIADDEPVNTEYYTLDGYRVNDPSKGFYIVCNRYADGSVKTSKKIL